MLHRQMKRTIGKIAAVEVGRHIADLCRTNTDLTDFALVPGAERRETALAEARSACSLAGVEVYASSCSKLTQIALSSSA